MIRNATILISYSDLATLRALADIDGSGCAENSLAQILANYFELRPEIAELVRMESGAKKEARKAWVAKWKGVVDADAIPGL